MGTTGVGVWHPLRWEASAVWGDQPRIPRTPQSPEPRLRPPVPRATLYRVASSVRVDFHCHSSCSDGALPPEGVAHMLAEAGVRCAALTDHDTCKGLSRFRNALRRHGIAFVSGIELSADHPTGEIHLLALGFPLPGPPGFSGSRPLGSRIRSGVAPLMRGKGADGTEDAGSLIRRMHAAGALVYLAHPLHPTGEFSRLETLLDDLRPAGLDGIEALYKPYPREDRSRLARLAGRHGLLIVGGSDFHGDGVLGSREPGCEMPRWHWERLSRAHSIAPLDAAGQEESIP